MCHCKNERVKNLKRNLILSSFNTIIQGTCSTHVNNMQRANQHGYYKTTHCILHYLILRWIVTQEKLQLNSINMFNTNNDDDNNDNDNDNDNDNNNKKKKIKNNNNNNTTLTLTFYKW